MLGALYKAEYTGPILYELDLEAPATIARRPLTYADFRVNYEALMQGEKPVAIGVPIEEKYPHWNA